MTEVIWRNTSGGYVPANSATPLPIAVWGTSGYPAQTDSDGNLLTGSSNVIFFDQVDGTAVDTSRWIQSTTTMTIAQANGFITLNNGAITTLSTSAQLTSVKQFQLYAGVASVAQAMIQFNNLPQTNATAEVGLFAASGTSAPTDGIFLRFTGTSTQFISSFGGVETIAATVSTISTGVVHKLQIGFQNNLIAILLDGAFLGLVSIPTTQPFATSVSRLPISFRVYTGGSAPALAPQILIGAVSYIQLSYPMNRLWEDMLVMQGRGSYQSPLTAFAQTANHTNSTDPVAATLSNTAAGYTTLGGRWTFAAVAGAVTDYALFGFQVPASYQLCIRSIAISAVNLGAAVATTPTVLDWSIGINSSAVSLATADGAGTWAPRRIPIGLQSFLVAAGIGTQAPDITRLFPQPLVVDSGRFFHVILEMPVGTATGSQTIRGDVVIDGWFE